MPCLGRDRSGAANRNRGLQNAARVLPVSMIAALMLTIASAAHATSYTVDTISDTSGAGNCSLRDAMNAANGSPTSGSTCGARGTGTDTIQFSVTGTIALTLGTLPGVADANLTITGPGGGITIDGGNGWMVNSGAVLNLRNLTIANAVVEVFGCAGCVPGGGAIYNGGTLTITNSTFSGNSAFFSEGGGGAAGGAIASSGTLTITNSTFSGNSASYSGGGGFASGGAIASSGTLTVTNSTFYFNSAWVYVDISGGADGGAISNAGTLTISNSTFSGNGASAYSNLGYEVSASGGAIASSGTLTVTNSTFSGNGAQNSGNIAGGGTLKGTILAYSGGGNCSGGITDGGYNMADDTTCSFVTGSGSRVITPTSKINLDPLGLRNNGGPTQTIALLSGSPAIDAIPFTLCTDASGHQLTTDQRGMPRPDPLDGPGGPCDIGAYEFQKPVPAQRVLGQTSFEEVGPDYVDAQGLSYPSRVAIDRSVTPNRIYVADWLNSRVLGWHDAESFVNGAAADLVVGQPDFLSRRCDNGGASAMSLCNPVGVAVDSVGNLYVADSGDNRVLEYDSPFTKDTRADRVFGQAGSFGSAGCNKGGVSPDSLCGPWGVALDSSDHLYVADSRNNRVLEYITPLSSASAFLAIGQSCSGSAGSGPYRCFNLFLAGCNKGGGGGIPGLCNPRDVALDPLNNLYVADWGNGRVVEYDAPLYEVASGYLIFAQRASAVALDSSGDLYVADGNLSRVLEYDIPLLTDTVPDRAFGAGANCSTFGVSTASGLCEPAGLAFDAMDDLYVADQLNNRVLQYTSPLVPHPKAERVLGQVDFSKDAPNLADAIGMWQPASVAIDSSVSPSRLYVVDRVNSRVLGWSNADSFANGAPAAVVIGQPGFTSNACNSMGIGATSLCLPSGAAVDSSGHLYVADQANNRVLEYDAPFVTGAAATLVFGQGGSFTTNGPNKRNQVLPPVTAGTLYKPASVAVDSLGNLYVSDWGNHRVLEYFTPVSTDTLADLVIGQPNLSTNTCASRSAATVCQPAGIALDSERNLYVADADQNRILEFNAPLANGAAANKVLGQSDFTSQVCGAGGLCEPEGISIDTAGNLYVADSQNNRVLRYNSPLATGTGAGLVFGQIGFTSTGCNQGGVSATTLCGPSGVAVDAGGNLFVTDLRNNRLLKYVLP